VPGVRLGSPPNAPKLKGLAEARSGGARKPPNREVATYWLQVIEANQGRLVSGDPDLIYPGETIVMPPFG
jgi:hypothetical protein